MGAIQVKAKVELSPAAMARARKLLRGAPARVATHRVTVGIHETEGARAKVDYHGDAQAVTLAEVALMHELGLGGQKDRSFLRTWFDTNLSRFKTEMAEAMRLEYEGDREAVARQSAAWARELQDWIAAEHGGLKALAPSTVRMKEAAGLGAPETPLLATAQLVNAIKARVDGADA